MITREQKRMQVTWERLVAENRFPHMSAGFQNHDNEKAKAKKYLIAARKTAMRIYTSHLGQALAFLLSHDSKDLYDDISQLVEEVLGLEYKKNTSLIDLIRTEDHASLFVVTEEAIAICSWLSNYLRGNGVTDSD